MRLTGSDGGQVYALGAQMAGGAEGALFHINNHRNAVAKVYHKGQINPALERKLKFMMSHPIKMKDHIAWPKDLLYDNSRFVGFVMPKFQVDSEINHIYVYNPNPGSAVGVYSRIRIAQNICSLLNEIHNAGFVVGDFNHTNIGVKRNPGQVFLMDTDSIHIEDKKSGLTYRCAVCMDGYAAPELIEHCKRNRRADYLTAPLPTFTRDTDKFSLGVHIFRLLMNGVTPYNGVPLHPKGSSPTAFTGARAVERDQYCFKPGKKPQSIVCPPQHILPDGVIRLFNRTFIDGRAQPSVRPSAREWYYALGAYENNLKQCAVHKHHQYDKSLSRCPWCEADARYQADQKKRPLPAFTSTRLSGLLHGA